MSIKKLAELINDSKNIVFFGGAGCSTESNIPDFRGNAGIYSSNYNSLSPETILSKSFFEKNPDVFYDFYCKYLYFPDTKPNITHYFLAELERMGKLKAIITQNIDGLHQLAGSKKVIELHGSCLFATCQKTGKIYTNEEYVKRGSIYSNEGGIIKPNIVLYQENLDQKVLEEAIKFIKEADLLIIGGTSLVVSPAKYLISYFRGKNKVILNLTETSFDDYADLVIHDKLGNIFSEVKKIL